MSDFCDCSQCPHHCGGNEEEYDELDEKSENESDNDSEDKTSDTALASAEKKIKSLKHDIKALGFKLKNTKDGLRVSQ